MRRKSTPCTTGREEIGLFAWQLQSGSAHGDENASQTITAGRWIRSSTAFLHCNCSEMRAIGTAVNLR
jgi:hypothetical protein